MLKKYVDLDQYTKLHLYGNEMVFEDDGKSVAFIEPYIDQFRKEEVSYYLYASL